METFKVLSIDIGIINLGYVYSEININTDFGSKYKANLYNENFLLNSVASKQEIKILDCNRIDITKVKHRKVPYCSCKLHHDRCIPDYLDHFIQETPHFENCDILILERQPPVGITNVQDLLFKLFRDKVQMVSPGSVHKYFSLPSGKPEFYNLRKELSESLAQSYLLNFTQFTRNNRKHDIADAMLMTIYFYKTKKQELIKQSSNCDSFDEFEKFRFV